MATEDPRALHLSQIPCTSQEVVRELWQHWLLAQVRRHQEFVILVTDFQQSKKEPPVADCGE